MTITYLLKMSLLLLGLGIVFVLGVQTISGTSALDESVSTVNDWMGHGDEDHHETHHDDEDHETHHETHHDDGESHDNDACSAL